MMTPAALQQEIRDPRTVQYQLSVERYHAMIAAGLLDEGEPFELLDGNVVRKDRSHAGDDPKTVGHEHALIVMKLNALNLKLAKLGCHLRPQQPLTLPPSDEPEPDAAIVRGTFEDYADRHPGAKDVLCVIEVADSSVRRDQTTKLRIYAAAGIGQYVIFNLVERVVEIYTEPVAGKGYYGPPVKLTAGDDIEFFTTGKPLKVPVRNLMRGIGNF